METVDELVTRFLLNAQMILFLAYGAASGLAFKYAMEEGMRRGEVLAYSSLLNDPLSVKNIPLNALSELPL